jgi:hypothetical protein
MNFSNSSLCAGSLLSEGLEGPGDTETTEELGRNNGCDCVHINQFASQ